ncbi:MAG: hypothetical protein KAG14_05210, partial [Mycoplasmataceae bacterium]|nr:hypothetical protein [Mycoplasmataceae bacterium]
MEDIKRLMHTFPDSDKIFEVKENMSYHVVNKISDMWEEEEELCLETGLNNFQKATMRISVVDDFAIKVRYSQKYLPKYKFNDHIVNQKNTLPKYKIVKNKIEVKDGGEVKCSFPTGTTGSVGEIKEVEQIVIPFKKESKKLVITKNPFNMEIYDVKSNKQQMSLNWRDGFKYFGGFVAPGLGFKQIKDDDWMPFLSWEIKNDENFYGLGEKFGKLEKTGTRKTIWNTDTSGKSNSDLSYNALPFVQSTNNWAILMDTGSKSYFDIGASIVDAGSMMNTNPIMEFYLFAGDSIKDTTIDYTNLTGRIKGISDRAYGIWFSRLYYHDKKELNTEIQQAKKFNIPFDVAHIDPKWIKNRYTKSNNFVEATERWGDFTEFYKNCLDKDDIEISLWTNPYIQGDDSEFFKTAKSKNYLVKNTNGELAHPHTGVEVYQSDNYLIDLTNKDAY